MPCSGRSRSRSRAPTSLADVCEHLRQTLKAPVVLDRAALDRQELKPEDPVQLQLEGVRLKMGLKLLLDQVGLTFQVVPEDNLLILTDSQGSADPIDRVLTEIKALHRDVHDLQDAVDEIRRSLGVDAEGGAEMRKPTIIEEMPPPADGKSEGEGPAPLRLRPSGGGHAPGPEQTGSPGGHAETPTTQTPAAARPRRGERRASPGPDPVGAAGWASRARRC